MVGPRGIRCRFEANAMSARPVTSRSYHPPCPLSHFNHHTGHRVLVKELNYQASSSVCEYAWNKDPVFGVIGIQSGPPERRVHSGFHGGHGSQVGDAGSGDDRKDPSGVVRSEEADQGDLPRASGVAKGRAQGDPVSGDRVSL
jgi:hypothetical protein